MKPYKHLFACVFVMISVSAFSQKFEMKVGQSTTNKLTREKPSQIIATYPKNDTIDNSALIDGFLEVNYKLDDNNLRFNFFIEVHKNTLVEKEQNVRQLGVGLAYSIYDMNVMGLNFILDNDFTYRRSRDFVKRTRTNQLIYAGSLHLESQVNPFVDLFRTHSALIRENNDPDIFSFSDIVNLEHDHSFGFGYLDGKENVVIRNLSFELNVYPFSSLIYKKVKKKGLNAKDYKKLKQEYDDAKKVYEEQQEGTSEKSIYKKVLDAKEQELRRKNRSIDKEARKFRNMLYLKWVIKDRNAILGRTDQDLGTFSKISVGFNYKIGDKSAFGLVHSWQRGADIYSGLDNQVFNTLAATLKVSL